jgi:chromosome segregation ATPase
MTTQVSPVTENDMRQFAEKVITSFVSLSEQARELVNLRQTVNDMKTTLEKLVGDNDGLRAQVETLVVERDKYQTEARDNADLLRMESNDHSSTRAELTQAKNNIIEYEADLSNARNALTQAREALVNAQDEARTQRDTITNLTQQFEQAKADGQAGWNNYDQAKTEIAKLREQIARIRSSFDLG